ncbi:MAG TPA: sugar phosphate isomerase/epimerase family protein [Terriglobia bacterium]|nr:sugar phosphate isomerase/epimerase family protein [Terriglobia bacterium]
MRRTFARRHFSSGLLGLGLGLLARSIAGRASPSARKLESTARNVSGQFKLGIITDEITENFEQALDFISSYSLGWCELRELWRKNIMNLSREELRRARELIQQHHLEVSDIGSPVFKYNLPEMPARPEKRDTFRADFTDQDSDRLIEQSFELARFFGTPKVRIFSFWRVEDPEKAYPYVRARLAKAAERAAQSHITLVLENEHECNIGTGKELGRLLRDINSPALRGNWDPGNAAMLHEVPYPDGYREVRGLFAHMHVKDVRKDPRTGKLTWAPVGGGFIDWRGQLQAVVDDGYDGTMSLETHYRRPDGNTVESSRESLEGLLKVLSGIKKPTTARQLPGDRSSGACRL